MATNIINKLTDIKKFLQSSDLIENHQVKFLSNRIDGYIKNIQDESRKKKSDKTLEGGFFVINDSISDTTITAQKYLDDVTRELKLLLESKYTTVETVDKIIVKERIVESKESIAKQKELTRQLIDTKEKLEEIKKKYNNDFAKYEVKKKDCQDKIKKCEEENNNFRKILLEMSADSSVLRKNNNEVKKQLSDANEDFKNKLDNLEKTCKKNVDKFAEEKKILESKYKDLETKLQELKQNYQNLQKKEEKQILYVERKEYELKEERDIRLQIGDKMQEIKDLEKRREAMMKLVAYYDKINNDNESLAKEIEKLRQTAIDKSVESKELLKERDNLVESNSHQEMENMKLYQKLQELIQKSKKIKEHKSQLKKIIYEVDQNLLLPTIPEEKIKEKKTQQMNNQIVNFPVEDDFKSSIPTISEEKMPITESKNIQTSHRDQLMRIVEDLNKNLLNGHGLFVNLGNKKSANEKSANEKSADENTINQLLSNNDGIIKELDEILRVDSCPIASSIRQIVFTYNLVLELYGDTLSKFDKLIEQYEDKINNLNVKLRKLTDDLNECSEENKQCQKKLKECKTQLESKEEQSKDFEYQDSQTIIVLQKRLEDCKNEVEKSDRERIAIQNQLENYTREQETIMDNYDRHMKETKDKIQKLTNDKDNLQKQLHKKDDELRRKNQTVEIKSDCTDEKKEINHLMDLLKDVWNRLMRLAKSDTLKVSNDSATQYAIHISSMLENLETKYFTDLQNAFDKTNEASRLLRDQTRKEYLETITLIINAYEILNNKYSYVTNLSMRDKNQKLTSISDKISSLSRTKSEIILHRNIIKKLSLEVSELEKFVSNFKDDIVATKGKLNTENREIRKYLAESKQKIEHLTEHNNKLIRDNEELIKQLDNVSVTQKKSANIAMENTELKQNIEKLTQENKNLEQKNNSMRAKMTEIISNNNGLYEAYKSSNNQRQNSTNSEIQMDELNVLNIGDLKYRKYNEDSFVHGGDTSDAYGGVLIGCGMFLLYYGFWSLVILSLLYFIYVLGSDIFVLSKCEEKYKYIKQDGELFSRGRLGYVSV